MSAESYAEYVFLEHILSGDFDRVAGRRWMPAEEMEGHFQQALDDAFAKHGYIIGGHYRDMPIMILSRLYSNNIVVQEGDELTGVYVSFQVAPKDTYIKEYLGQSEIGRRIDRLGNGALERALRTLADREGWRRINDGGLGQGDLEQGFSEGGRADVPIPAADRIVTVNHNQISSADTSILELVHALEADNGSPDFLGLRERAIGQIKAGRELIRSGEYRAYLLYEVLVKALQELVARYSNPTIVALANALLGAVVSKMLGA